MDVPTTGFSVVRDGVRLCGESAGSGEPVLFLHGMGGDRSNWQPQMRALQSRFQVIAFDCRGYGDSGDYPGPFRYEDAAGDCCAVLDHLGIFAAHLVGLSMGGRIAQEVYHRWPDRVLSLSLCDTDACFGAALPVTRRQEIVDERKAPLKSAASLSSVAAVAVQQLCSGRAVPNARKIVAGSIHRLRPENYIKALDALLTFDRREELPRITVPTLVLCGEDDPVVVPEMAEAMADQIPGARVTAIPGAGHVSNVDQPERFTAEIARFLEQASRTPGGIGGASPIEVAAS